MEEQIQELFSKHFNRMKTDLNQIKGFTPLMLIAVSSSMRNLENDVIGELEKSNGEKIHTSNISG